MSKIVGQVLLKVTSPEPLQVGNAGQELREREAWMREIQISLWRARRAGVQQRKCTPPLCFQSVLGGLGEDRLRGAPRVVRRGVARVVQAENAIGDC
jgi:hypothetical protein